MRSAIGGKRPDVVTFLSAGYIQAELLARELERWHRHFEVLSVKAEVLIHLCKPLKTMVVSGGGIFCSFWNPALTNSISCCCLKMSPVVTSVRQKRISFYGQHRL
jgi:hypothetical protein